MMDSTKTEKTESPQIVAEKQRIAELKAKRSALAAQRAPREELEALKAQALTEELGLRDEELIESVGVPLGVRGIDWELVSCVHGAVILSKPAHVVYRQFVDLPEGQRTQTQVDKLVEKCLEPKGGESAKAYARITEKAPGFTTDVGNVVVRLGKAKWGETEGK